MSASLERWTPAQRLAIRSRAGDLLVTAAAGSGKTAVLTRRVIELALDPQDPVPLDRLLVVTFTRAAAAELRERVAAELERAVAERPDDPRPRRQLALLGQAQISTLDAFCYRVVRENFQALDLDPAVRVLDEKDAELLQEDVLDGVLEDWHERRDPDFRELLRSYAPKGDGPVFEMVLTLHRLAGAQPDPEAWLAHIAERYRRARKAQEGAAVEDALGEWLEEARRFVRATLLQAARLVRQAAALAREAGGLEAWVETLEGDVARLVEEAEAAGEGGWARVALAISRAGGWPHLAKRRGSLSDPALSEDVRDLRDRAKDVVKKLFELGLAREPGLLAAEAAALSAHAETLVALTTDFAARYQAAKRDMRALDFADLERLTLRLLNDPTAGDPASRFDEVLVDEYQDINACQDAILTAFARRGRLFLVGDVKQSIYRFRLAEPSLFLAKVRAFPPLASDGRARPQGDPEEPRPAPGRAAGRVALRENFRSRSSVIDAVNRLFRRIFAEETAGLAYTEDEELVANSPHRETPLEGGGPEVEIHVLEARTLRTSRAERAVREGEAEPEDEGALPDTADDEVGLPLGEPAASAGRGAEGRAPAARGRLSFAERARLEREALWIGRRILELVRGSPRGGPVAVYDKDLGRPRPARFGDVAIVLRAASDEAPVVRDALEGLGIPVSANAGGYFRAIEVEWALALLALVDNPLQDIPLAAVLRSPLFGFEDGELAEIRLRSPGLSFCEAARRAAEGEGELAAKLAGFFRSLDAWRTEARRRPLVEVVDRIFRDTGLPGIARAMPGGERRARNLAALRARARAFQDSPRPGLFRFLRYIERLRERGDDLAVPPPPAGEDAVRVMTIHQSKGLEFPIVFAANLGGLFHPVAGAALVDRDLGLGLPFVDPDLRAVYPSLPWVAVRSRAAREERAEEARVLYVALTRARDRLILVGSVNDLAARRLAWRLDAPEAGKLLAPAAFFAARAYLDWVIPAALAEEASPGPAPWSLAFHTADELEESFDRAPERAPEPEEARAGEAPAVGPTPPPTEGPLEERIAELSARLAWTYPFAALSDRPAKRAASDWRWPADPASEEAGPMAAPPSPEEDDRPARRPRDPAGRSRDPVGRPRGSAAFVERGRRAPRGAEVGTALHLVFEHLPLVAGRSPGETDVRETLARLVAQGHVREAAASAVDPAWVTRFFETELGRRILADPRDVRREWMFTLGLPAAEAYPGLPSSPDDVVVIQGVVDLLVGPRAYPSREGGSAAEGWLLVDFKTDRLPAGGTGELLARHEGQVRTYARAVEEITGVAVREAYLYLATLGEVVAVPLSGLAAGSS